MLKQVVLYAVVALAAGVGGCAEPPPPAYPDVVYVRPGVYVLADVDRPIYFVNGYYWWHDGGVWVWSHDRAEWHRGRRAPAARERAPSPVAERPFCCSATFVLRERGLTPQVDCTACFPQRVAVRRLRDIRRA